MMSPSLRVSRRWIILSGILLLCHQWCFAVEQKSSRRIHESVIENPRELQDDGNQKCIDTLESITETGELNTEDFLRFLSVLTDGDLEFDTFAHVPLNLKLIFYATACSGGRDCSLETPTIILDPSSTLLKAFCKSISQVIAGETAPSASPVATPSGDQLKISFHYVLYYRGDQSPSKIFEQNDDDGVVQKLKAATERVVKTSFNCPIDQERRIQASTILYVLPFHDATHALRRLNEEKQDLLTSASALHLGGFRRLQGCIYGIEAVVDELSAYDCDPPPPSSDVQCALVGASVILTSDDDIVNKSALRRQVLSALSNAINKDGFV